LPRRRAADKTADAGPLDACASIAMRRGTVERTPGVTSDSDGDACGSLRDDAPRERDAVDFEGYDLNASVRIDADDDVGRERFLRYCAVHPSPSSACAFAFAFACAWRARWASACLTCSGASRR
jgi:hypothetical protein